MYKAKDGKNFGNNEMGAHYDKTRPTEKQADGDGGEHNDQDMSDVVAEHGPAEHVEIHSHHPDGHVHKAKHETAHEAHQHVDKAFAEGEESEGMKKHEDGEESAMPTMGIPGM